ncbi:hypothetical protein PMZ80_005792 [Knufia obscura]|uniref:Uncharacterized protein n=2 Tax=Knufia TaxID=430999 RepID=A0AAN8EM58_9EURO|nr:hypothetical protein PMZ80_005792 [Knufia obscura]KAK5954458.1 hypothetical protein OHC33_004180 [Knufia fluminis]
MAPSTKDKADKAQGANQFFKLVDRSRLSRPERERGRIDRKDPSSVANGQSSLRSSKEQGVYEQPLAFRPNNGAAFLKKDSSSETAYANSTANTSEESSPTVFTPATTTDLDEDLVPSSPSTDDDMVDVEPTSPELYDSTEDEADDEVDDEVDEVDEDETARLRAQQIAETHNPGSE